MILIFFFFFFFRLRIILELKRVSLKYLTIEFYTFNISLNSSYGRHDDTLKRAIKIERSKKCAVFLSFFFFLRFFRERSTNAASNGCATPFIETTTKIHVADVRTASLARDLFNSQRESVTSDKEKKSVRIRVCLLGCFFFVRSFRTYAVPFSSPCTKFTDAVCDNHALALAFILESIEFSTKFV